MGSDGGPPERRELWLADLVCPVAGPPIRKGAVLTAGGRVQAAGPADRVRPPGPVALERDFGRAILVPGLVAAHTHLELSGLELPRAPMAEWIVGLVRELRTWPAHLFLASARVGAATSLVAGVTCVGDVSVSGESALAMADAGLRGVVFHEVLGLDPSEAEAIVERRILSRGETPQLKGGLEGSLRHGVSPHAPYTTSLPLYRAALDAAWGRGWPTATHLAESPEEVRFLRDGGGPFAGMHRALGSPVDAFQPPGLSPVRCLADGGALDGLRLAVHCNQTDRGDWDLLRRAGVSVCLCPRSAAFFGHPLADVAGMRRAGLRLCLGTDSLASSPSLSLLSEAAALREADPELTAEELLRLCTRAGAEALGFAEEGVGQLVPGGVADFAVVDPPPGEDPVEVASLFHPEAGVRCTVTGGAVRFDAEA